MARAKFGGGFGDTVVSLFDLGGRLALTTPANANGQPSAVTLTVWDEPGGTQLTDLLAADGTTPITEVVVAAGEIQVPAFSGPDGFTEVWLRDPEGDYARMAVGPEGPEGRGVVSIVRTSGEGTPGTTDTYTITYTDETTSTFDIPIPPAGAPGEVTTAQLNAAIDAAINSLVDSAPGTLDTLNELAAALGDDPNFATTVTTALNARLSKASNLSDLTDVAAARDNLELGDAATKNTGTTTGTVAAGDDSRLVDNAKSVGGAKEKTAALSATTGTATGNLAVASGFYATPTGNITLAFSNVPASGTLCTAQVELTFGATTYTVTYPSGTKHLGGSAVDPEANTTLVVTLQTRDGGTTWLASGGVYS